MVISTEVEVLRQQLKGKGVYPAPPNYTHITQQNVHFRPIQPANLSPLQHQDRLFFDLLLSTRTGSTGSQSDGVSDPTQGCHSFVAYSTHTIPMHARTRHPANTICKPGSCRTAYKVTVTFSATQELTHSCGPPKESPGTSAAEEPLITLATSQQTPPQAQKQLIRSPQQP